MNERIRTLCVREICDFFSNILGKLSVQNSQLKFKQSSGIVPCNNKNKNKNKNKGKDKNKYKNKNKNKNK